jgi:Outer membrane protein
MQNKKLSADVSLIDVAEAKWKYAPSISASNNYSISQGRVLDQTTYDFIENKTVFGNSTSISASISLFNGLKNLAFLKKSKLLSATATLNVEKFENDLTLAITAQYLNILLAHENILNTRQVLRTLDVQRETISKMVVVGKVTKVDLFQIESKIADAQTNLLSYEHELQSAKLYIYELMGVDDFSEFEFNVCYADSILIAPEQIIPCNYSQCVENLPEIKIAKLNIDVMKQDLQLSRTSLFPSITLSAAYGSSYSDVRQKSFINPDGTYRYEKYPFSEQYKDNFNGYLSIGVEVPIFNGLSVNKK